MHGTEFKKKSASFLIFIQLSEYSHVLMDKNFVFYCTLSLVFSATFRRGNFSFSFDYLPYMLIHAHVFQAQTVSILSGHLYLQQ